LKSICGNVVIFPWSLWGE